MRRKDGIYEVTEKLYYEDSHRKVFDAVVLSCEPLDGGFQIVLDQTAFFPEGGGQYADTGYLQDVKVTDVREKDGILFHMAEQALVPGQMIEGRIDWEQRFARMQQHSGEHILSGLVNKQFGYGNVGFHLGDDYCTLDFNGPITEEEAYSLEYEANQAVFQNVEVQVSYPSKEELENLSYRSKIEVEGQIRIVSIPGYDVCACCAPHVCKTGEIGLIKIVQMVNYKGGRRLTIQCGIRALADYGKKARSVREIGSLLCEKEDAVSSAVSRLKEEYAMTKSSLLSLQKQMLTYQARDIEIKEEITAVFEDGLTGDCPRELMNLLLDKGAKICAVFARADGERYRYVIGSKTEDVRPVSKALNERFDGRGGGKPQMAQGSLCGSRENLSAFLEAWL